jgi:hypothetical protein
LTVKEKAGVAKVLKQVDGFTQVYGNEDQNKRP